VGRDAAAQRYEWPRALSARKRHLMFLRRLAGLIGVASQFGAHRSVTVSGTRSRINLAF